MICLISQLGWIFLLHSFKVTAGFCCDTFIESPLSIRNITVIQGKNVTLQCNVNEIDKYLKRTWTQGSSVIFADSKKFLDDSRWTLIANSNDNYVVGLQNANVKDEEMYTCRTYGSNGAKQIFRLIVNVPPFFVNVTNDLTVDEGSDVTLVCDARGKPPPEIIWRHLIPSADGIRSRSAYLPLGNVNRGSAGKYECIADNGIMIPVRHWIQLTVNYSPEIDRHYSQSIVESVPDSSASLKCVAIAVPAAHFVWILPDSRRIDSVMSDDLYDVVDIEKDNTVQSRLFLSRVSSSDFGNFTCVATNFLGAASFTTYLSKKNVPPTRLPPPIMFGRRSTVKDAINNDKGSARLNSLFLPNLFLIATITVHGLFTF